MSDRDAFLRAIRDDPDADAPRLVFADWLDDHGEHDRAEFIRVQCAFEPLRDDYESDRADALRRREAELTAALTQPDQERHCRLFGPRGSGVRLAVRRGLEEEVALPARWFIEEGDRIRDAYPTVTRAVFFRVNGWGERLAACPHLAGLRELHVACWVADADFAALFASPHLASLRALRLFDTRWSDEPFEVPASLPMLREVEVWWGESGRFRSVPGGPTVRCVDPVAGRLYAFAPGGDGRFDRFFPGRLPDGTQFMGQMPQPNSVEMSFCRFRRDGSLHGMDTLELPSRLAAPADLYKRSDWFAASVRLRDAIADYLRSAIGHKPGLVRVRACFLPVRDLSYAIVSRLGTPDHPDADPEANPGGHGFPVWDWLARRMFCTGHDGELWVDGRTGHIV